MEVLGKGQVKVRNWEIQEIKSIIRSLELGRGKLNSGTGYILPLEQGKNFSSSFYWTTYALLLEPQTQARTVNTVSALWPSYLRSLKKCTQAWALPHCLRPESFTGWDRAAPEAAGVQPWLASTWGTRGLCILGKASLEIRPFQVTNK